MTKADLDKHKNKIIKELKLKHIPPVLFDEEAITFVKLNVPLFKHKNDKNIKKRYSGYYHYENIHPTYATTGVVCIFNNQLGTLAHELWHAKQFQDNNKWLVSRNRIMNLFYKIAYIFYPAEREAFKYAISYLEENELYKLANTYKRKVFKGILKSIFCTLILLLDFVMIILYLFHYL